MACSIAAAVVAPHIFLAEVLVPIKPETCPIETLVALFTAVIPTAISGRNRTLN
jgi:hypothetical protein